MKKPKRISLALKVNIVIMAMVLSVSVLLILISENTYQKAVFRPYFRKPENTEIPVEELKPTIQELMPHLGTDELNRIISEKDEVKRDLALTDWLLNQPGLQDPPLDKMIDDWMDFELSFLAIQSIDDLHEISCYAEKNGNRYVICAFRDNDDYIRNSSFINLGQLIPDSAPAEKDYLSPNYLQEDGKTLLVRFIPLTLEDGGQVWFRLSYDLTEEIQEHGIFCSGVCC